MTEVAYWNDLIWLTFLRHETILDPHAVPLAD